MKAKNVALEATVESSEPTFTKEQIVESKKYGDFASLLVDGQSYTLKEVDDLIENYMKGEVK